MPIINGITISSFSLILFMGIVITGIVLILISSVIGMKKEKNNVPVSEYTDA